MRSLTSGFFLCAGLSLALALAAGGCGSNDDDGPGGDASVDANDGGGDAADAGASEAGPGGSGDVALRGTINGTITLPAASTGKPFGVRLYTQAGVPGAVPVAQTSGTTSGATLNYAIANAPEGTYFLLGFVDVDASGGDGSTPGDFAGWYGHTGDGNPPAAANAVVTAGTTTRYDFSLVQR
jgi:hypothetical protein